MFCFDGNGNETVVVRVISLVNDLQSVQIAGDQRVRVCVARRERKHISRNDSVKFSNTIIIVLVLEFDLKKNEAGSSAFSTSVFFECPVCFAF